MSVYSRASQFVFSLTPSADPACPQSWEETRGAAKKEDNITKDPARIGDHPQQPFLRDAAVAWTKHRSPHGGLVCTERPINAQRPTTNDQPSRNVHSSTIDSNHASCSPRRAQIPFARPASTNRNTSASSKDGSNACRYNDQSQPGKIDLVHLG
mmetsp:Transcript_5998/g.16300  ORF Transcript_5998/g.16300 Transcript_5998/m.16300 type:complete len:154 (-) Transcript_5998:1000-1461(-)